MEQRLSCITLGVHDLAASRRFYVEGFGFTPAMEVEDVIFFQVPGLVFALWGGLAADLGAEGAGRGPGMSALAYNVRDRAELPDVFARAVAGGGQVVRPAHDTPWGGVSGYVADPDGHLWEIAWNPFWPIGEDGSTRLAR